MIKTKDAAALPAAVPQTQSRSVMPHAAIEPSMHMLLRLLFYFYWVKPYYITWVWLN